MKFCHLMFRYFNKLIFQETFSKISCRNDKIFVIFRKKFSILVIENKIL